MNLRVAIRPAALRDISDQHNFIAADHSHAALQFLDAIDDLLDKLSEYPDIGRACEFQTPSLATMRQIPLPGFEQHLLFYRRLGSNLILERVLHASRDIRGILDR